MGHGLRSSADVDSSLVVVHLLQELKLVLAALTMSVGHWRMLSVEDGSFVELGNSGETLDTVEDVADNGSKCKKNVMIEKRLM